MNIWLWVGICFHCSGIYTQLNGNVLKECSQGNSVLNMLRNCWTAFQISTAILPSPSLSCPPPPPLRASIFQCWKARMWLLEEEIKVFPLFSKAHTLRGPVKTLKTDKRDYKDNFSCSTPPWSSKMIFLQGWKENKRAEKREKMLWVGPRGVARWTASLHEWVPQSSGKKLLREESRHLCLGRMLQRFPCFTMARWRRWLSTQSAQGVGGVVVNTSLGMSSLCVCLWVPPLHLIYLPAPAHPKRQQVMALGLECLPSAQGTQMDLQDPGFGLDQQWLVLAFEEWTGSWKIFFCL